MKKRKLLFISGVILLSSFLCGCSKVDEEELLPISHEPFVYTIYEKVNRVAVDEQGLLYTVEYHSSEKNEDTGEWSDIIKI